MKVKPILNLNQHFDECEDYSLVNANNIKLTKDGIITNDNVLIPKNIKNSVSGNIVGCIPCNKELVIFTDENKIYRYNEINGSYIESISDFDYNGGRIKGTFTYNVNNELIIAFSEYGNNIKVPLKTINLDKDKNANNKTFSLVPKVIIPKIINLDYIQGSAYKGWYHVFIRYKINTNDYTQWYSIGYPIFVDEFVNNKIIDYWYSQPANISGVSTDKAGGFEIYSEDAFSNNKELCNISFKFNLYNFDNNYNNYQLGYIITNNDSTKTFITHDIPETNRTVIFNSESLNKDYKISVQELITEYYNYYNTKNIINYKNRLYLSNFKEKEINVSEIEKAVSTIRPVIKTRDYANSSVSYSKTRNAPATNTTSIKISKAEVNRDGSTSYKINEETITDVSYEYSGNSYKVYIDDILSKLNINISAFNNIYVSVYKFVYEGGKPSYVIQNKVLSSQSYIQFISPNYYYININGSWEFPNKNNEDFINPNDIAICISGDIGTENLSILYQINNVEFTTIGGDFGGDDSGDGEDTEDPSIPSTPGNDTTEDIKEQNYIFNNDSLLPNEVYNFYIHFVDIYGNYTDGFKLPVYDTITNTNGQKPALNNYISYKYGDYVYFIKNDEIFIKDVLTIPSKDVIYYTSKTNYTYDNNLYKIVNSDDFELITESLYTDLTNHLTNSFNNVKYIGYKWGDVLPSVFPVKFTNVNGNEFIKTPLIDIRITKLLLSITNVRIPNGYIGYFVSYEKMERITDTAVMFKSNHTINSNSNIVVNNNVNNKLYDDNTKINYIYSDKFDINDSIKIDYDFIMYNKDLSSITYVTSFEKKLENNNYKNINIKINNAIQLDYDNILFNTIIKKELLVADEYVNLGNSTRLKCEFDLDFEKLPPTIETEDADGNTIPDVSEIYSYSSIIMVKLTKSIYRNKIKELIKLGDICYTNIDYTIANGYNGKITTNSVHYYNNILFDDTNNVIKSAYTTLPYYGSLALKLTDSGDNDGNEAPYKHYAFFYLQNNTYDTYYHESKEYNNKPLVKSYIIKITENNRSLENRNIPGTFVTPANSTDLFKNNRYLTEPIKTYTNYDSNKLNITQYDNRIIQSNIIGSESAVNNWRKFNVTEYKDINDNKGKITNIVGIGDLFLVHTEHSMFILDVNNYLVAIDKTVKTEDKELLEINHKEVFTSQVGFGGLQDSDSWIVGVFGYIWFNNDTNRFMRYDNGKFDYIDKTIFNWMNNAKPTNVRFADDKDNNRLLISFKVGNNVGCISYNYNTNAFVSINNMCFDKAYNTKNITYLMIDNAISNISNTISNDCKISIVVNTQYELIKYLEFITYKLFTVANTNVNIYNYSPVEGKSHVYAGDSLTIYNDLVNTGKLDISNDQENEFDSTLNSDWQKPYFHLGNWNVNKLYDVKNVDARYGFVDKNSRLYGNYFIIEFEFKTTERFEFEELNCQFTTKIN